MAETPDDGLATFTIGGREVQLSRPTTGQQFVILQLLDLADETDVQVQAEACLNFGTVLRTCFQDASDRQFVLRGLATGELDLPDYLTLATDMIQYWSPEQYANREQRRQQQRRAPVKKAAPAKRAGAKR